MWRPPSHLRLTPNDAARFVAGLGGWLALSALVVAIGSATDEVTNTWQDRAARFGALAPLLSAVTSGVFAQARPYRQQALALALVGQPPWRAHFFMLVGANVGTLLVWSALVVAKISLRSLVPHYGALGVLWTAKGVEFGVQGLLWDSAADAWRAISPKVGQGLATRTWALGLVWPSLAPLLSSVTALERRWWRSVAVALLTAVFALAALHGMGAGRSGWLAVLCLCPSLGWWAWRKGSTARRDDGRRRAR